MTSRLLDALPLALVLLLTVVLLLIAYEGGYFWGRRDLRRRGAETAHVGTVVGALLSLLAFMLGFVFAMADERFDQRKTLVLNEANAIGTTWLRARTLPPPFPERIIPLLRDYLEVRADQGSAPPAARPDLPQAMARSDELHERLWLQTIALARTHPESRLVPLFMSSLNEMIDLHQSRVTVALDFRIASSVWWTLYIVAALALAITGYHAGRGGAHHPLPVTLALLLALSTVLVLILDLDRPAQRLFRVEHRVLAELHETMESQTAGAGPHADSPK